MLSKLHIILSFYKTLFPILALPTMVLLLGGQFQFIYGALFLSKLIVLVMVRFWYWMSPKLKNHFLFYHNLGVSTTLLFAISIVIDLLLNLLLIIIIKPFIL